MGFLKKIFGSRSRALPAEQGPAIWDVDFVVIDVETACSRTSSICQIGIVGFRGGREVETYETLIDPRDDFDGFNVDLHGIGPESVIGQPSFAAVHSIVSGHLGGRITVAHSNFDKGAIASVCARDNLPAIPARWLDSVNVARQAWPHLGSHRLNVLADYLGIDLRHHDALSDARAAGLVIVKAIDHTGIDLESWLAPRPRPPEPSLKRMGGAGPLAGHSVSFTGEFSVTKKELADELAAAGASTTAGPTKKTTIFVVGEQDMASLAGKAKSSKHLKAEALLAAGQAIQIVDEAGLRRIMSSEGACS